MCLCACVRACVRACVCMTPRDLMKPRDRPTGAQEGDVLMLTKPLGVQMAIAASQQVLDDLEVLEKVVKVTMSDGCYGNHGWWSLW